MLLLRRLHLALSACFIKFFRTREVLKVFRATHAAELKDAPYTSWPMIQARQAQEIASIKAGKLDITDRKSWAWPFLPSCSSEDSEILTQRGFIPVAEMQHDDVFATRTKMGVFEWQDATAINKHRYIGPMVQFDGTHVDALVTPNHRMLIRERRFKERATVSVSREKIKLAENIANDERYNVTGKASKWVGTTICQIPLRAKPAYLREDVADYVVLSAPKRRFAHNQKSLRIKTDVWIQFLALYLADGSCDGTTNGIEFGSGKKPYLQHITAFKKLITDFTNDHNAVADRNNSCTYRVRVSCKDTSATRKDTAELLTQIPVGWGSDFAGFGCGSKALWFNLFELGNSYTKYVPDFIKQLPDDKLELFVKWLKTSDGWVSGTNSDGDDHGEYGSTSKQLTEDIAAIFVRLGYAVRITSRSLESGATGYRIYYSGKNYCNVTKISTVDYDGYVYCPSVPNGIICLRRNGKIFWTGNSVQRLSVPVIKTTPYNIRRMARSPVPRRAINLIKGSVIAQNWDIRPIESAIVDDPDEQQERCEIARKTFKHPNNSDSYQNLIEMMIEDICITGASALELKYTINPDRPMKMWAVNPESIRIFVSWSESTPDMPHYAQMTGLKGERGAILFYDDEMLYLRDNQASDTPFGLGRMEVAFQSVNAFLGIQDMAGRAGADQVHKTWLWWEQPQPDSSYQIVRRHIQNELEGQAKVSIIGGMKKPEIIEINPVTEEDLLLNWQEMLIRMIANAFDLSAMSLGVEQDVNRAVGQVLSDRDFRSAVVPMARRIEEAFTRKILHAKLGMYDLEFKFLNLDDPDATTKMTLYSQMYGTNAITPKKIAVGMGMQPPEGPFADLTQFEAMLLLAEVQSNLLDRNADRATKRQQAMQAPPEGSEGPNSGNPDGDDGDDKSPDIEPTRNFPPSNLKQQQKQFPPKQQTPSSKPAAGSGGSSAAPKMPKLTLPKFPVAAGYTAMDLVNMPINELTDLIRSGKVGKASDLLKNMKNQEPGILEQMSDETKEFFERAHKEEEKNKKRKDIPAKTKKEWQKEQAGKVRDQEKRSSDYTDYLYKHGSAVGKPGGVRSDRPKNPGKPGEINKWSRP